MDVEFDKVYKTLLKDHITLDKARKDFASNRGKTRLEMEINASIDKYNLSLEMFNAKMTDIAKVHSTALL